MPVEHLVRIGEAEHHKLLELAARSGLPQRTVADLAIRYFADNMPDWFIKLDIRQARTGAEG